LGVAIVDRLSNAKSEDGGGAENHSGDVECGSEIPWKHYIRNQNMRRVLLQKGFYLGFETVCGLPYLVGGLVVFCRGYVLEGRRKTSLVGGEVEGMNVEMFWDELMV